MRLIRVTWGKKEKRKPGTYRYREEESLSVNWVEVALSEMDDKS
jgi:hypothetical protein